jgi:succinyl-CoA synthetase alpha subunit
MSIWTKIVTLYSANGKFHSLVQSILAGLLSGLSLALVGGIPLNKSAWIVAGGLIFGAIKGAVTGWLRANVAVASVQGTGATPAQVQAVAATAAVNTQKP